MCLKIDSKKIVKSNKKNKRLLKKNSLKNEFYNGVYHAFTWKQKKNAKIDTTQNIMLSDFF